MGLWQPLPTGRPAMPEPAALHDREPPERAHQGTEPAVPGSVRALLSRDRGTPLDAATRRRMEQRFGEDFGGVRVHAGTDAADSARALRARAYTVGHDIVFGAGRHAPDSPPGERLLAHELAHVVQQRRGGPPPTQDSGSHLEQAAAAAATHEGTGGPVQGAGAAGVGVARAPDPAAPAPPTMEQHLRTLESFLESTIKAAPPVKTEGTRMFAVTIVVGADGFEKARASGQNKGLDHAELSAIRQVEGKIAAGDTLLVFVEAQPCADQCRDRLTEIGNRLVARGAGMRVFSRYHVVGQQPAPGGGTQGTVNDYPRTGSQGTRTNQNRQMLEDEHFKRDPNKPGGGKGGPPSSGAPPSSKGAPPPTTKPAPPTTATPKSQGQGQGQGQAPNPAPPQPAAKQPTTPSGQQPATPSGQQPATPSAAPPSQEQKPTAPSTTPPAAKPPATTAPATTPPAQQPPASGAAPNTGTTPSQPKPGTPAAPSPPQQQQPPTPKPPTQQPAPPQQQPPPRVVGPAFKTPSNALEGAQQRANARAQGVVAIVQGLFAVANNLASEQQRKDAETRLNQERPKIIDALDKNPGVGVMVELQFSQWDADIDTGLKPADRFVDLYWYPAAHAAAFEAGWFPMTASGRLHLERRWIQPSRPASEATRKSTITAVTASTAQELVVLVAPFYEQDRVGLLDALVTAKGDFANVTIVLGETRITTTPALHEQLRKAMEANVAAWLKREQASTERDIRKYAAYQDNLKKEDSSWAWKLNPLKSRPFELKGDLLDYPRRLLAWSREALDKKEYKRAADLWKTAEQQTQSAYFQLFYYEHGRRDAGDPMAS
ncbi:MAG: DUF4157 domain-containing protein [Gemmataceae bacterium]|nr:DUF4157 domain-containing protein [Gemmataceae bacterium]